LEGIGLGTLGDVEIKYEQHLSQLAGTPLPSISLSVSLGNLAKFHQLHAEERKTLLHDTVLFLFFLSDLPSFSLSHLPPLSAFFFYFSILLVAPSTHLFVYIIPEAGELCPTEIIPIYRCYIDKSFSPIMIYSFTSAFIHPVDRCLLSIFYVPGLVTSTRSRISALMPSSSFY
jgi:hypothetical protein